MYDSTAVELLFGGMEQLGPGDDAHTLEVLRMLPRRSFDVIVDAGCGTGRQTLALARELVTPIDAVDSITPFLQALDGRARAAGVGHLVRTHAMDMRDIPTRFPTIDLLWAEGSAYAIGFENALRIWGPAIAANGFVVVSELCWLRAQIPPAARAFFATEYPDMRSVEETQERAVRAGYRVSVTYPLPSEVWETGYYRVIEPRARSLQDHPNPAVRGLAIEMLNEIAVFRQSEQSYGYVFFVLQPS